MKTLNFKTTTDKDDFMRRMDVNALDAFISHSKKIITVFDHIDLDSMEPQTRGLIESIEKHDVNSLMP